MKNYKEYYLVYFRSDDRKHYDYKKFICTKDECEKQCKKIIENNSTPFSKYYIDSPKNLTDDLHSTFLATPYVYLPATDEWYHPFEIIPYPQTPAKKVRKCNIITTLPYWYEEDLFEEYQETIDSKWDNELFWTPLNFALSIGCKCGWWGWQESYIFLEHIKTQLERLKKYKQTTFYNFDDSADILWETDKYIRFLGEWNKYNEIKYFEYLIPKEKFYASIDKMFKDADKLITQDVRNYKNYLKEHGYPENYKLSKADALR